MSWPDSMQAQALMRVLQVRIYLSAWEERRGVSAKSLVLGSGLEMVKDT